MIMVRAATSLKRTPDRFELYNCVVRPDEEVILTFCSSRAEREGVLGTPLILPVAISVEVQGMPSRGQSSAPRRSLTTSQEPQRLSAVRLSSFSLAVSASTGCPLSCGADMCMSCRACDPEWRGLTSAGVKDLQVLKTTQSGYAGFLHDKYTMLPDTSERIVATSITSTWRCVNQHHHNQPRLALLTAIHDNSWISVLQLHLSILAYNSLHY